MSLHPDLLEAMSEKNKFKDKISPLAAILLVTDYSSQELEEAIDKLDFRTHDRVSARFANANYYLRHYVDKQYRQEREEPTPIKYYTIKEFAAITKSSVSHIRNLVENNLLPYTDFAGKDSKNRLVRISEENLKEFLKHQE
jgi:excisionase family DNA binding protein